MTETYLIIYQLGLMYTIIGGIIVSFLFAIGRWIYCVREYIETGNIDDAEGSFFLGKGNWFWGEKHRNMNYYNNPWIVALDIVCVSIIGAILALIWPISVIVTATVTYAMVSRIRVVRKKEFMDKLKGEHDAEHA